MAKLEIIKTAYNGAPGLLVSGDHDGFALQVFVPNSLPDPRARAEEILERMVQDRYVRPLLDGEAA